MNLQKFEPMMLLPRRLLISLLVFVFSRATALAQIDVSGYHLVYSSESPEAASALLDLTDDELECCTGDFLSPENMERHWQYCPRQSSTWNMRMGTTDEERALVNIPENGHLRLLAVSLDGTVGGFVTGGVRMNDGYKYGIIEVKAKCIPHQSNFPAIWMMPVDQTDGWPNCGEIDIMEQIGTSSTVYSTVHLGARYDKNVGKNYLWSGNRTFNTSYHVYSLLWDETSLTFYTDGIRVFSYTKDASLDLVNHPDYEKWQFPYNKAYYLILDQALGFNSWWGAEDPDPKFTYEMDVQYVRIWQKEEEPKELEYVALRNYSDSKRFMAATNNNLLTTTTISNLASVTDNMLFAMKPTNSGGKHYLMTKDGRYVGYKADANNQVDLSDTPTPYYVIKDEVKGLAFDYVKSTAPFTYTDGSRALFMNYMKGNVVTTSATSKDASWWVPVNPDNIEDGIKNTTEVCEPAVRNGVYNMQGQRIATSQFLNNPTTHKGIYIVNGRKVIL